MKIAVIGIQGGIREHINSLEQSMNSLKISGEIIWARNKTDLENANGIVIPGGESTTIKRLMALSGMDKSIKEFARKNLPILGTCAGAIILSDLGLIDIKIERNSYGRQIDSFESKVSTDLGETSGVFIRAPLIKEIFGKAKLFASRNNEIVGAKQGNISALTFHPELSKDNLIFNYFLQAIIKTKMKNKKNNGSLGRR
tara:strand:+ start:2528 stop:3124 length:597 start_codon:yes stop_codon:yes gene_type:complete